MLEVDDMVRFQKPDWKCVFTYVQSFYRRFRDGRSPPPRSAQTPTSSGTSGEIKLSEVARAVAECQEAEESGRKIVKQLSCQDKTEQKVAVTEAKQTEKMIVKQQSIEDRKASQEQEDEKNKEEKEEEERPAEKDEVCSDLPCRAVESASLSPTEETPAEVHTESVSITLKPSPKPSSAKISRSKSVATDHPDVEEDSGVQERKLSFNHPMPSMSPPALTL